MKPWKVKCCLHGADSHRHLLLMFEACICLRFRSAVSVLMNGRLKILMKMTLCLPLHLDVLFHPLSCLTLQVLLCSNSPTLSNLIISTLLTAFSLACVFCPVTQGSLLHRTRTSRKKKMLQNTPTTLGSLTHSGSHWVPLCSRAVTSLRGNGGQ